MANEKVTLELDLTLDDGTVKKALAKIPGEAKKTGKKAGKDFNDEFSGGLTNIFKDFKSTIAGGFGLSIGVAVGGAIVKGIQSVGAAIKESISSSIRQEESIFRLENSLRRIGEFSPQASQGLQEYASSLQQVTRFGDEAILEQIAFAQGLGATVDQSKAVVKASLDLASALNIDVNSAVRNITKTLSGQKGELGELIPALRNLTAEQLRNGEGIKLISELYKGFAERDAKGLGSGIQRLGNSFGDFTESLGSFVTQSDIVKTSVNLLIGAFDTLAEKLRQEPEVRSIKVVEEEIKSLEFKIKDFQKQTDELRADSNFFTRFIGSSDRAQRQVDDLRESLKVLQEERNNLLKEQENQAAIREQKEQERIAQNRQGAIESLRALGLTQLLTYQEIYDQQLAALETNLQKELITIEQYNNLKAQAEKNYTQAKKAEEASRVKASFDANRALGSIVANQTQTFVKSLLAGEKAGSAFKNFILGSFGELATQLGSFYIATGIAQLKLFSLDPTGTIAAGAALVALGQILGSFQSKGLTGGETGTAAGTTPFSNDNITEQINEEPVEPETRVAVNIQGNIIDSPEAGSYIIDAINRAVDGTGATIRRNALA